MARRRAKAEEAQVDMTPMLDVTFIMLIFFIVTMSFVKPTGIDVHQPHATTTKALAKGNVLIGVNANDEIYMNKHKLAVEDVRHHVEADLSSTPKGSVVVVADEDANTSQVIKVMDQARLGGAKHVWIATKKPSD